jgi:hypothetical protein
MGLFSSVYNLILEKAVLFFASSKGVASYLLSPHGWRSSPSQRLNRLQLIDTNLDHDAPGRETVGPICLFVAYSHNLSWSSIEYLTFFKRLGFRILYINNTSTSQQALAVLSRLAWMAFDRPNLGQDIGAYKDGVLWLEKNGFLNDCSALAIVNDSMQFIPGTFASSMAERITEFLASDAPALFSHLSQQVLPHYQSFFQVLKPEVFRSRPFLSFWEKYIPYSHRFHCIYNGEIKLSQKVYNWLSGVHTLYTSEDLHHQLMQIYDKNNGIAAEDLVCLMPSPYRTIIKKIPNPALNQLLEARGNRQELMRSELICISDLIENSNPTHVAAFLYPYYLSCPLLKRDICFAGTYTIAQAINLYRDMLVTSLSLAEEKSTAIDQLVEEYEEYLYKKGVPLGYANRKITAIMKGLGSGFVYSGTYSG